MYIAIANAIYSSGAEGGGGGKVPLTDATFQQAVNDALAEEPVTGLFDVVPYGMMPDWDVSQVTIMSDAFDSAEFFNGDISAWDVSSVTDMDYMFASANSFNQNISTWNTISATNMAGMFVEATAFNQDISSWDVSSVEDMAGMFEDTQAFNQNINSWDVSSVEITEYMFAEATVFNQPLDSWDVSNVTDMNNMFADSPLFNQSLNSWDVSSVEDMNGMFSNAEAFDGDISAWDVSSVTKMDQMFSGNNFGTNTIFNRDISAWDVSNVTNMRQMFYKNIAFNQNLSLWGITQVANFIDFMPDVTLSTSNYDALLIGWDAQGAMSYSGTVDFGSSQYTSGGAAEAARTSLIAKWGGINDGGVAPLPFIFSVNTSTRVYNSSATDQYLIPLYVTPQDLFVEWGDGTSNSITTNTTEQRLHTYPSPGVYTITIYGNVQGFYQDSQGNLDARKVRNIFQWGGFNFTHKRAFHRCTSMSSSATDVPTISTTDMSNSMGWDFNGSVDGWDVSSVTNMEEMFFYTDFNQSLASWDFSNVTNIKAMFKQSKFNQDVSNWDTSSVTNMDEVFFSDNEFNQSLANWNIENVTSFVNFAVGYQKTLLDTPNYDATLIGWGAQTPLTNRTVNFGTSQYTSGGAAEAARNTLINTYGWTITDGGPVSVPLILRVKTDNVGASNDDQFTLQVKNGVGGYNYDIEYDGQTLTGLTTGNDVTLTFPSGAGSL